LGLPRLAITPGWRHREDRRVREAARERVDPRKERSGEKRPMRSSRPEEKGKSGVEYSKDGQGRGEMAKRSTREEGVGHRQRICGGRRRTREKKNRNKGGREGSVDSDQPLLISHPGSGTSQRLKRKGNQTRHYS
jgi:hypothetical protein